jgi:hypothetical protein
VFPRSFFIKSLCVSGSCRSCGGRVADLTWHGSDCELVEQKMKLCRSDAFSVQQIKLSGEKSVCCELLRKLINDEN